MSTCVINHTGFSQRLRRMLLEREDMIHTRPVMNWNDSFMSDLIQIHLSSNLMSWEIYCWSSFHLILTVQLQHTSKVIIVWIRPIFRNLVFIPAKILSKKNIILGILTAYEKFWGQLELCKGAGMGIGVEKRSEKGIGINWRLPSPPFRLL